MLPRLFTNPAKSAELKRLEHRFYIDKVIGAENKLKKEKLKLQHWTRLDNWQSTMDYVRLTNTDILRLGKIKSMVLLPRVSGQNIKSSLLFVTRRTSRIWRCHGDRPRWSTCEYAPVEFGHRSRSNNRTTRGVPTHQIHIANLGRRFHKFAFHTLTGPQSL